MTRKSLKSDAKARHDKLCDLILKAVELEGHERHDYQWAILPRQYWAEALGVDDKTISRLIKLPPIWTMRCQVMDDATGKAVQAVALRVGDPPERTPELVAGIMSKAFRKHTGKASITPREFGCLVGLAKAWPEGHQERIFSDLLANWAGYMAAIKSDAEYDPTGINAKSDVYLRFPSIKVIRRFQHQVPDFYLTRLQLAGQPIPFGYAPEGVAAGVADGAKAA